MTKPQNPLQPIFDEIDKAITHGLYWLALTSALSLPGICGALERDDHWSGRDEYKDWFERYLAKRFAYLTADDCYGLRCGIVHKATSGVKSKGKAYQRVLFTLPDRRLMIGQGLMNDTLTFDAVRFCNEMMNATREWFDDNWQNETVVRNSADVFRYRPNGFPPEIVGLPVIA